MPLQNYFSFYGVLSLLIVLFSIAALSSTFLLVTNPNYEIQLPIPEDLRSAVSSTLSSLNPNRFSISQISTEELSLNSRLLNSQNVSVVKVGGEECEFRQESSNLHLDLNSCNIDTTSEEIEVEVETQDGRSVSLALNPKRFLENLQSSSQNREDSSSNQNSQDSSLNTENSATTGGSRSSGGGGGGGSSSSSGSSSSPSDEEEESFEEEDPPFDEESVFNNSSKFVSPPIPVKGRIVQLGVSNLTFSSNVSYVIHPDGGASVKLDSNLSLQNISTATLRHRGGAMWNPFENNLGYASGDQGWDIDMARRDYRENLNVAPIVNNNSKFNISKEGSLVIAIPAETYGDPERWQKQRGRGPVAEYRVINFVETLPPNGSYRGSVRHTNEVRPNWNQEEVYKNLDKYFPPKYDNSRLGGHSMEDVENRLRLMRVMAAQGTSWTGFPTEDMMAQNTIGHYGGVFARDTGKAILDLSDIRLNESHRREMADYMVQTGIDLYGIARNGSVWQSNGGHTQGRIWLVLVAGLLLEDEYILNMVEDPLNKEIAPGEEISFYPFSEQRRFKPVQATLFTKGTFYEHTDQYREWGTIGNETTANRFMGHTHRDIGMPTFNIVPDRNNIYLHATAHPKRSYHTVNYHSQVPPRLAMQRLNYENETYLEKVRYILNGIDRSLRSAKAVRSSSGRPGEDTRYSAEGYNKDDPSIKKFGGAYHFNGRTLHHYNTLNFSDMWKGRPSRAFPPYVTSVTANTFRVSHFPLELDNGYPILSRNLRWKINNGSWNYEYNYIDDAKVFHTGSKGDTLHISISLVNQAGESSYSNIGREASVEITEESSSSSTLMFEEFLFNKTVLDTGAQIGKDYTSVPLQGLSDKSDGTVIQARILHCNTNQELYPWRDVATVQNGEWKGSFDQVYRSTQWMKVQYRIKGTGDVLTAINCFGTGHVWSIYGQSNWARMNAGTHNRNLDREIITHPEDVQIFKKNNNNPTNPTRYVMNDSSGTASYTALANALTSERPGEKFAIAFHTHSGTSPADMIDAPSDGYDRRSWEAEQGLYDAVSQYGKIDIGVAMVAGWAAFNAHKPNTPGKFTQPFFLKTIDGTQYTKDTVPMGGENGLDNAITDFHNWSYTRFVYAGGHGAGKGVRDIKNGYRDDGDRDYMLQMDNWDSILGSDKFPETLPRLMDTRGAKRGKPKGPGNDGSKSWTDTGHHSVTDNDGMPRLAKLGVASTLKTLGLVEWPVPAFNRRYDHPQGAYVEFWMDGHDITTERLRRSLLPIANESDFDHRTEVMGFSNNGFAIERAEIVPNAGSSSYDGVRVYPNLDNFSYKDDIQYGEGNQPGYQHPYDNPDEYWLNLPVVDVGQRLLPALPVKPRSTENLEYTGTIPDMFEVTNFTFRKEDFTDVSEDIEVIRLEVEGSMPEGSFRRNIASFHKDNFNLRIRGNGQLRVKTSGSTFTSDVDVVRFGTIYTIVLIANIQEDRVILTRDGETIINETNAGLRNVIKSRPITFLSDFRNDNKLNGEWTYFKIWFNDKDGSGTPYKEIRGNNSVVENDPWYREYN